MFELRTDQGDLLSNFTAQHKDFHLKAYKDKLSCLQGETLAR